MQYSAIAVMVRLGFTPILPWITDPSVRSRGPVRRRLATLPPKPDPITIKSYTISTV